MMLNTCFGCCSLRSGVNMVAIINMIITSVVLLFNGLFHLEELFATFEKKFDWESRETTPVEWQDHQKTSDFIFDMHTILLLATNIGLKQSTFTPALQKIYVWLVINYITLLCLVINLINYITLSKILTVREIIFGFHSDFYISNFIMKFLFAVIRAVEIYVVQSYYIKGQIAKLNDNVLVKWEDVSKNQVICQGTTNPSASTFIDTISRQTQEG